MNVLEEIEAIKRLKYRYLRCLDLKEWDALAECFAIDATVAYGDGKFSFAGREKIMQFLRDALGAPTKITSHRCHQPEIEFDGPDRATATWALDDVVIDTDGGWTLHGAAYYFDHYTRLPDGWKIQSTGYKRVFEEIESRADRPTLRLTSSYWQK